MPKQRGNKRIITTEVFFLFIFFLLISIHCSIDNKIRFNMLNLFCTITMIDNTANTMQLPIGFVCPKSLGFDSQYCILPWFLPRIFQFSILLESFTLPLYPRQVVPVINNFKSPEEYFSREFYMYRDFSVLLTYQFKR